MRPKNVDCGCQTDNDAQSKKMLPAAGRRIMPSSGGCPKKPMSTFSIRSAPDRNTPIPSVLSVHRLAGISPRKSAPGRNVAAAVFVPKTGVAASMPETKNNESITKVPISRSQSDSVFETSPTLSLSRSIGKQYASIECMSRGTVDEICPKSPVVESMRVINEGEVASSLEKVSAANEELLGSSSSVTNGSQSPPKNKSLKSPSKDIDVSVSVVTPVQVNVTGQPSESKQAENTSTAVDNQQPISPRVCTSFAASNSSSPKSSETVLKQPIPISSVITLATSPPRGETENVASKTVTSPHKVTSDDRRMPSLPADMAKKCEMKKTSSSWGNSLSRPPGRSLDLKLQQRPNVAERKTNSAVRIPPSRSVNPKYVKNVGVPKIPVGASGFSVHASTEKGDQRKAESTSAVSFSSGRVVKGKFFLSLR